MKDSKTSDVSACIWNRDQCVHPPPTFYGYFGQENIYRISPDLQRFFLALTGAWMKKKLTQKSQFESMNKHVCSTEYNALIFSLDKVTYWGRNYNEQILIKMNEIILFRKKNSRNTFARCNIKFFTIKLKTIRICLEHVHSNIQLCSTWFN